MATKSRPTGNRLFLGIECGGTRTVALLAKADGRLLKRIEAGPANLRLVSDAQLLRHFKSLANEFPRPAALGIGMAGMRTEIDRRRITATAAKIWPAIPCVATNDLETALAAAGEQKFTRILVLSGTGSCCYGRSLTGKTAKVGGWGHILGDQGSGYDIGLRALKLVIVGFDHYGKLTTLGRRFLRKLQLNEPNDFIAWAQNASKPEIAALAEEVLIAANQRDKFAKTVLKITARPLATDAVMCTHQLTNWRGLPSRLEFIFAGSVLLKQRAFAEALTAELKKNCPTAEFSTLSRESAWGAVELARQLVQSPRSKVQSRTLTGGNETQKPPPLLSLTERRNPRSMHLDKLPVAKAIELMLSEDAKIPRAIMAERRKIERAIGWIVTAFKREGRLFYIGAGTSGRLGILDASECPPTFRTPPDMVQGIIAGGQPAIWQAVEGAEDDAPAGARAIGFRNVSRRDVVVGIAASGGTPFVHGALMEAKRRGAKTVLLCFNPFLKIPRAARPHLVIAPNVGPEVLTGSTRLKAGTATKLVLNLFTTLAMVRLGKVAGNLMVDLNPSNTKLRARAIRIVRELTGADEAAAQTELEKSGWMVKAALRRLQPKAKKTAPLKRRNG